MPPMRRLQFFSWPVSNRIYLIIFFPDIEEQECLWIIEAPNQEEIQLSWTSTISDCPETSNHVYVYDGLPKFVSKNTDRISQTLGFFCLGSHYLTQTTKVRLIYKKAPGGSIALWCTRPCFGDGLRQELKN